MKDTTKLPEKQAPDDEWQKLHERAIRLFDQWLTNIEVELPATTPDLRKNSELVNIFTILRRILEIRKIQQSLKREEDHDGINGGKTGEKEEADDALDEAIRQLDPEMFGD